MRIVHGLKKSLEKIMKNKYKEYQSYQMYQKCVLVSKFINGYRKLEDHIVEVS